MWITVRQRLSTDQTPSNALVSGVAVLAVIALLALLARWRPACFVAVNIAHHARIRWIGLVVFIHGTSDQASDDALSDRVAHLALVASLSNAP